MIGLLTVGLLVGGASTGVLLWVVGGLIPRLNSAAAVASVSLLAGVAVLRDLAVLRFPLPQRQRLVPQSVFYRGLRRGATRFGFELGLGFRTKITSTSPYLLALVLVLLTDEAWIPILSGVSFGLGRGLMPLLRSLSQAGEDWDTCLTRRIGWVVPAATATCALAVLLAL